MALVAYNASSDSDSDIDSDGAAEEEKEEKEEEEQQSGMFAELPAPKLPDELSEPELIVEPSEKEIALRTKPPPPALAAKKVKKKILLPALHDKASDDDDDEVSAEDKKQTILSLSKGSFDVFGNLPKPKHSSIKEIGRTLLPHVLTKQAESSKDHSTRGSKAGPQKSKPLNQSVSSKSGKAETANKTLSLLNTDYDSDDEDNKMTSFFSLETVNSDNRAVSSSSINISLAPTVSHSEPKPLPSDGPTEVEDVSRKSSVSDAKLADTSEVSSSVEVDSIPTTTHSYVPSYSEFYQQNEVWQPDNYSTYDYDYAQNTELTSNDMQHDIGQFQMPSVGQKRKRRQEKEIEVIEVNLADHLNSSSLELTKNLTVEQDMRSHSKKRNKDMPTSQQKRKHQITYLAHQAKERELELKNQWAENKFSKKQTQSKYGF